MGLVGGMRPLETWLVAHRTPWIMLRRGYVGGTYPLMRLASLLNWTDMATLVFFAFLAIRCSHAGARN